MSADSTQLATVLVEHIRAWGPITFAKYMDACLYDPQHGYYTRADQLPRRDYFTSVDASPIFGRLLARQFQEMWVQLGHPAEFCTRGTWRGGRKPGGTSFGFHRRVVSGILQRPAVRGSRALRHCAAPPLPRRSRRTSPPDISPCCQTCPQKFPAAAFSQMNFSMLCPSIASFAKAKICAKFTSAPARMVCANRFGPLSSAALAEYLTEQGITLQEGQLAEVNLEACAWIAEMGARLGRGFALTIDYGHEAQELYDDRHMRGTLLAYENHRAGENFFRAPGQQDLTAHVNFTALDRHGNRAGLQRTGLTSQSNFLLSLARHSDFADLQSPAMTEAQQTRARLLFKTLIYPEGMGETFQVLIQHKGVEHPHLSGLDPL